jgi:hypothetical protein
MGIVSSNLLRRELAAYGVQNPTILDDVTDPEIVDYLDLVPGAGGRAVKATTIEEDILPDAVAESQGRPLLYVINKSHLSVDQSQSEIQLRQLCRSLGSRGDRTYLAILEPGQLTVMPVALTPDLPEMEVFRAGSEEALTFFSRLSLGDYHANGEPSSGDYVYHEMFSLLQQSADELTGLLGLDQADVLSLVGRALFFRFLCDREIVRPGSLRSIAPNSPSLKACFETPESAASTCKWLDATFNGDFLPLSDQGSEPFFHRIAGKTRGAVFQHLSAILHGHEPVGSGYQLRFDEPWAKFDFAHVPVDLLSQVYEAFSWKWSPDARGTSVHYTPRRIAEYLVEEAFHDLKNPGAARVLDPACGAGIFLVLAFRRLYQANWKATGQRPDTTAIRHILESQLAGFDVSEPALRLAALSLYLTAIELDPDPIPPSKLRFTKLRDRVLFNFRRGGIDPEIGPVVGSLGSHVGAEHDGAYDVVLCNPPWTSLEGKYGYLAFEFNQISQNILTKRGLKELAETYQNPDNVPDLPFVWRATEWCRRDGRIGMVLPGRNLFKQEAIPLRAREALFRAVEVNGILNCSNLSDTQVWPEMNQPFFLLFARNRKPRPNHVLRWVTPHCDINLNRLGDVRIDSKSVELISTHATFDEPWLWKALSVGTSLDIEIIRKIKAGKGKPLQNYWENALNLTNGRGYQIGGGQPVDASFLAKLPELDSTERFRFFADAKSLKLFGVKRIARPRKPEIYRAPLILVKESSGEDRASGWALVADESLAYNRSFYGYSAFGHAEGKLLVRYLHLFFHSKLWNHYSLVTSPKLGTERRSVYKSVLDQCPIIPWETLSAKQKSEVQSLSEKLASEDVTIFHRIDNFFYELYGLNAQEIEVIKDTLDTALPYMEYRERACEHPDPAAQTAFAVRLTSLLQPFVRKHGREVSVDIWTPPLTERRIAPYSVLRLGTRAKPPTFPEDIFQNEILPLANESGASRVIFQVDNGLAIAILNQRRYWTLSRARLCAAEVLNRHMGSFG